MYRWTGNLGGVQSPFLRLEVLENSICSGWLGKSFYSIFGARYCGASVRVIASFPLWALAGLRLWPR